MCETEGLGVGLLLESDRGASPVRLTVAKRRGDRDVSSTLSIGHHWLNPLAGWGSARWRVTRRQ